MENSDLNWQLYGGGYLAKPSYGYYLVYRMYDLEGESNLWLAKYKASGIQKHPLWRLDFQRFASVEKARAACEKHAQVVLTSHMTSP
jgi:hypothetical protein